MSPIRLQHTYLIQTTNYVTEADSFPLSIVTSVYTGRIRLPKFLKFVSRNNLLPPERSTSKLEKELRSQFSDFKGAFHQSGLRMEVQGLTVDYSYSFQIRISVKANHSKELRDRLSSIATVKVEDWVAYFKERLVLAIENSSPSKSGRRYYKGYYVNDNGNLRYCPSMNKVR